MTWYDYIPFNLQVWKFHTSRLLFRGGRITFDPLPATFWRHWGYVFSGVDVARAIVWMGKIHGLRWNGDLTASTTRRWTKTYQSYESIIEGSLNRNFRQYGELKSSSRVVKSVDRRCNSVKVKRKKIHPRQMLEKSRNAVFFQWFVCRVSPKVGLLKRRVRR